MLLLDEPSAGLDASETETLAGYLDDLRNEGVSLLVIDHKLDFITELCDRVAVLELGHLVAVGDAATVFEDQRVIDAYLGVAEVDVMLEIRALEVSYGPVLAVRGIDVDVKMGEVVAMIGPNGAGKTSTLRAISGLVPHRAPSCSTASTAGS